MVKFIWFFLKIWTSFYFIYYIYKTRNYSHWLFPFLTKKFRKSFLIIQASLKKLLAAFKFFAFWSPVSRKNIFLFYPILSHSPASPFSYFFFKLFRRFCVTNSRYMGKHALYGDPYNVHMDIYLLQRKRLVINNSSLEP